MTARFVLILGVIGLIPIALSYGVAPSASIPYLLGFPVEGVNQKHVFRAIMGLYLANAAFWLAGVLSPSLRVPALWTMVIFMAGLAAGRVLSILVDGVPSTVLILYLMAELAFAGLAIACLRTHRENK